MKVEIAENSGFCFGVKKAIDTTVEVSKKEDRVKTLGPLIHNRQVIEILDKRGVGVVEDIDQVDNEKLIIRSHGVSPSIYDRAKEKEIDLVDCTCPFVRKVQEKARDCYQLGKSVIIVGDENHPEVIGINGWCDNSAYIVGSLEDVEDIPKLDSACIVAQTTMINEKFDNITEALHDKIDNIEVYNTICSATRDRQKNTVELAKRADAMIVIGGKNSSNTKKLVELSKNHCKNVYFIETADEIDKEKFEKYDLVGITAGASTPDWIIEEVFNKMNNMNGNSEMEKALEESFVTIKRGDIVDGEVVLVTSDEVIVNVGYKADGIISKNEYSNNEVNLKEEVNEGDKITVMVINTSDNDGNVVLSKKRVQDREVWKDLDKYYENRNILEVDVKEVKDNGLIVDVQGVRGFIPISQISTSFVRDLSKYRNSTLNARIIDIDPRKNRLVLSSREVEEENMKVKKEEIWDSINEGQVVKGVVENIMNYGAFIDIGEGVTGLLHVSDMAWTKVNDPKDIVSKGEDIEVIIKSIDRDKNRISLSLKDLQDKPWEKVSGNISVGDIVEGKVKNLMPFGAFVEVLDGVEGLVHISQISEENIAKPSDVLSTGDTVEVKVLNIDLEKERMELSMKEAKASSKSEEVKEEVKNEKYTETEDEKFTIGDFIDADKLK